MDILIMGRLDTGTMHGHWDNWTTRKLDSGTLGRWENWTVVRQSDKGAWDIGTMGQRGRGTMRQRDNTHWGNWTMGQWDTEPMELSDNGQSDNSATRQWDNGTMRQGSGRKRFR
jgi:hypothetical protein